MPFRTSKPMQALMILKTSFEHEDWRTNGLVLLDLMAERLMQLEDPASLCDPNDSAPLLDWAAENMPELEDDLTVDEGVEF